MQHQHEQNSSEQPPEQTLLQQSKAEPSEGAPTFSTRGLLNDDSDDGASAHHQDEQQQFLALPLSPLSAPSIATSSSSSSSSSGRPQPLPSRMAISCQRCRVLKIKCDGQLPCGKCWSTSSICLPSFMTLKVSTQGPKPPSSNQKERRGKKKKRCLIRGEDGRFGSASSSKGEAVENASSASPFVLSVSSRQDLRPPQRQPQPLQEQPPRGKENDDHDNDKDGLSPGSLLFWHLQLQKEDPRAFNSLHMRIFGELHAQGNIDRNKALGMMRRWHVFSLHAEMDVSWGLAAEMARTLEITADELEGKEVMVLDSTPEQQRLMARQALMLDIEQSKALLESERFRCLNKRGTALWLASFDGEKYLNLCNERYCQLFPSPQEVFEETLEQKKVPAFLYASLYAPDDRELYVRASLEKHLGVSPPSAGTHILKAVRRDREIGLFIVNVQHFVEEDGRHETYIEVEPAPPSRHLKPNPSTSFQKVMQSYRQPTPFQERLSATCGGGGGDDGHVDVCDGGGGGHGGAGAEKNMPLLSGVACLPLPALPVNLVGATVAPAEEGGEEAVEAFTSAEERGENANTNGDLHEAGTSIPVPFFDANVMDNIFEGDDEGEEQEEGAGEGVR